ncbi:monoamine oxidase [Halorientalis sp. IM1011]|uniref:MaoC/PaaZ C-terminal domain-containing protein n=1 Tax=Halorientalis sp. IM1011 TaxID=1932360 RepID=UPI00097CCE49|nr:MaoC/PaaZ C-terminal domain-containing protein [Halorientalis sp. IM1011]AQL41547.1 monoamine oxidase [Halorientalis sp. IM1011]
MTESYFETVEIGEQRETKGRTITEADVMNFAGVSGDFNHLHTDAETMADSEFGERIAHGMLVFSVATGLLWQSRSEKERDAVVAFYGIDEVRFVGPTFIGDTIHVEIEVLEKERRDHPVATGVVRYDIDVVTQAGDTVLSCEMLSLVT